MTRRLVPLLSGVVASLLLAGCPDDPYSYTTWTKQLSDPHTSERAVTELEQLGNPGAIPDLGKAWASQGKPVRLLQVIIGLARPMTPAEAAEKFFTDYEKTGRDASWDKALPFLKQAIDEIDENNPRSVDSAQKAADAIGEAGLADGLDSLITLATKPPSKKIIAAQISAVRAMGKMEGDKSKAVGALQKLIDREPPQHPRSATKEEANQVKEKFSQFLGITGSAINALGDLHVASAAQTLAVAMYRVPELFGQTRRALVAVGPSAKEALQQILQGKYQPVNDIFTANKYDLYCGEKKELTGDKCKKISAKDFYPAVVLGDFYDPKTVPDLLTALSRPALPVYYDGNGPSPNTQHNAIFDALRKIGSPDAAATVRDLMLGKTGQVVPEGAKPGTKGETPLETKILAVSAYPFLARDQTGMKELGDYAKDNKENDDLRTEAATSFARLASTKEDIDVLLVLSKKYLDESNKKKAEMDAKPAKGPGLSPRAEAEAADKEFAAKKKENDEAKAAALKATKDPSMTVAQIKAATARAKETDLAYEVAKDEHTAKTTNFKRLEGMVKDYKAFARMFQTHAARVEVAIRCKKDLACYAGTLKLKPEESAKNVMGYIKDEAGKAEDTTKWTKEEQLGLWEGEVERAMLELGKAGQGASAHMETLLDAAKSDDRLVRQSILLALPKIAKIPCSTCEAKLDVAIKAGEGKLTLGDLNNETTMLRNYFAWAGGKTPSKSTPAPDAGAAPAGSAEAPKTEDKKDEPEKK